jgi:alpha-D-ribose 1-methylphosphonate 5-triphosphate diphosphatase PhnM
VFPPRNYWPDAAGDESLFDWRRENLVGGRARAPQNRPRIVGMAKARGVTFASHDDTAAEEVALAHCDGVTIAEFPPPSRRRRRARPAWRR